MREWILVALILLGLAANAQRKRTTAMFDADTTTRPGPGLYGIGVRDSQPWLINSFGTDPKRIVVEDKFIVGVQLNTNTDIEYPGGHYQGRRTEYVSINKDSLTITLPNPRAEINKNREVGFVYLGFCDELFKICDSTHVVAFTDTIFSVYSHTRIDSVFTAGAWYKYTPKGDSIYAYLPNTYIGNLEGFIKHIKNGIKPYGAFRLKVIDRRWYMIFRGIEY